MNIKKRVFLLMLFFLLSVFSLNGQAVPDSRVFAIFVFDTSDVKAQKEISIGRDIFLTSFEEAFNKAQKKFYMQELSGDLVTRDSILRHLNSLKGIVTNNDTVFFFFLGHGGLDDSGHFLAFRKERFYRKELESIMKSLNSRLTLIFTDSCASSVDTDKRFRRETRYKPVPSSLIENLFFDSSGIISVNSSKPYQSAWSNINFGGYFTYAFSYFLNENFFVLDRNGDGKVNWFEFLAAVDEGVQSLQTNFSEENKQTLFHFIFDVEILKRFYEKYVLIKNRSANPIYVSVAFCKRKDFNKCEWLSTYSLNYNGTFISRPLFYRQILGPFEEKYATIEDSVIQATAIRVVIIDPYTNKAYFWGGKDFIYDISNGILGNGYFAKSMETFIINVP